MLMMLFHVEHNLVGSYLDRCDVQGNHGGTETRRRALTCETNLVENRYLDFVKQ